MRFPLLSFFIATLSIARPTLPLIAEYWPAYVSDGAYPQFEASKLSYYFVTITITNDFEIPVGQKSPASLISLAHQNGARVLFSLGGYTGSAFFSNLVATSESRAALVSKVIKFNSQYGFDGIDLDWEYPGRPGQDGNIISPNDSANLLLFLQSLRAETSRDDFYITAAVSVFGFAGRDGSPLSDLSPYASVLTYINLMTYDISGPWSSTTGPLAPFASCKSDSSVIAATDFWISRGFPANQILLGIPSYAISFSTAGSTLTSIQVGELTTKFYQNIVSPIRGACPQVGCSLQSLLSTGILSSDQLSGQAGFIRTLDPCTQSPYLFNPSTREFISYEDDESLARKSQFAMNRGLAGVMIFDANGFSSSDYNVIQNSLGGSNYNSPPSPTNKSTLVLSTSSSDINVDTFTSTSITPTPSSYSPDRPPTPTIISVISPSPTPTPIPFSKVPSISIKTEIMTETTTFYSTTVYMATVTAGRPLETSSVSNSANSVPVEATSPTSTDTLATTSSISTASPVISLPQQEFQCVTRNTFKIGNGSIQRMSDGTVCVDGSIDTIGYAV